MELKKEFYFMATEMVIYTYKQVLYKNQINLIVLYTHHYPYQLL